MFVSLARARVFIASFSPEVGGESAATAFVAMVDSITEARLSTPPASVFHDIISDSAVADMVEAAKCQDFEALLVHPSRGGGTIGKGSP